MSTRLKRNENKRRERGQDPGPITRRQQVAAIRQIKGDEIAAAVSERIREAVKQEVEMQLKTVKDTMLDCLDRVVECEFKLEAADIRRAHDEGDGDDRQERTEDAPVLKVAEVVPDEGLEGEDCDREDGAEGSTSR